ncbi:Malic enzyme [Forsythia ovata]|uniref:Malic enzyme n=1 Tax=Forsythia ovata TaxID=205694 RepID=A0ABD1QNI3_9LAMI
MALQAVSRMAGPEADPHFFLLDKNGLITKERKDIDPAAAPFAKTQRETEGLGLSERASLIEVVKKVKPHVLLGLSGVGGIFNEEVLKAMRESDSTKPAIFAMSNPTANGLSRSFLTHEYFIGGIHDTSIEHLNFICTCFIIQPNVLLWRLSNMLVKI